MPADAGQELALCHVVQFALPRILSGYAATQSDGEEMPFPDAQHAIVPKAKIQKYLLDVDHPVGGPKALWLMSLGYSLTGWLELAEDLLQVAKTSDAFVAKPSPYGVKYEVQGMIGCAGHRPAAIVTVWITEGDGTPRLITAHPGTHHAE